MGAARSLEPERGVGCRGAVRCTRWIGGEPGRDSNRSDAGVRRAESFVATSAAIALFVDGARLPVYLATQWRDIVGIWPYVVGITLGVILGTLLGTRLLARLPQRAFRRAIGTLLVALGLYMTVAGRG